MTQSVDAYGFDLARELCLLGNVASVSCQYDPRFSYYLYVPKSYFELRTVPVLALVHGSNRNAYQLREWFKKFAEDHGVALFCPLFSIGLIDEQDTDNYKNIEYRGIRYDEVLLQCLGEVTQRYPKINTSVFSLYGFSGGAQFVHRFAYLHPHRLSALLCSAPGAQTLWDDSMDYPRGTKHLSRMFPRTKTDANALRSIPTLFICGLEDVDTSSSKLRGRAVVLPGGRLAGTQLLAESWAMQGASAEFVTVPGAKHEEAKLLPVVLDFLRRGHCLIVPKQSSHSDGTHRHDILAKDLLQDQSCVPSLAVQV